MSTLEDGDKQAEAVRKPGHERVTLADLQAKIVEGEFFHPSFASHVTVGVFKCANGYVLHGISAPADPANFDMEFGRKLCRDDAIRQLWPILGYELREKLHQRSIK